MTEGVRKTVLICEDEPNIRESIRYVVERAGFGCLQARDGYEAYQKACNERPDLVILDVGMPGMSGFEVCEKLRSNAMLADIKIIILTAFGQAEDVNRAALLGADRFMTKPFSPRVLQELLHELLL